MRAGRAMQRCRAGARVLGAGLLALGLVGPGAGAQVPFGQADLSAVATGTIVHIDAVQSGQTRLIDVEEGFTGATVASKGLGGPVRNEMERVVQPALADKFSYGRGSGLEVGLAVAPSGENQIIEAAKVEASALPNTELLTREIGPVQAAPLAYASLLRGQAKARYDPGGTCVLGDDLSRGLGFAADVQLLGTAPANPDGTMPNPIVAADANLPSVDRGVAQSLSHTLLVRQVDKAGNVLGPNFGLMSETRMTIAPITLFKGTANQTTIEFLGEWVLQVVAGGLPGGAFVWYGPGNVSPQTPVLRTIDAQGQVSNVVTLQQVLGAAGLEVAVPNVATITIGEPPRAIGGAYRSAPLEDPAGTAAAAAVDVARIKVLEQRDSQGNVTTRAFDIRVGHMEGRAQVPAGGISCSVPVSKVAVPPNVNVGQSFTTTITVSNPFDCDLTNVKLTDDVKTTKGTAVFKLTGANPAPSSDISGELLSSKVATWSDIGPIKAGERKDVTVTVLTQDPPGPPDGAGEITDVGTAEATLANCRGQAGNVAGVASAVAGAGVKGVSAPLRVGLTAVLGERLARTGAGAAAAVLPGLGLLGLSALGAALSRRRAG